MLREPPPPSARVALLGRCSTSRLERKRRSPSTRPRRRARDDACGTRIVTPRATLRARACARAPFQQQCTTRVNLGTAAGYSKLVGSTLEELDWNHVCSMKKSNIHRKQVRLASGGSRRTPGIARRPGCPHAREQQGVYSPRSHTRLARSETSDLARAWHATGASCITLYCALYRWHCCVRSTVLGC